MAEQASLVLRSRPAEIRCLSSGVRVVDAQSARVGGEQGEGEPSVRRGAVQHVQHHEASVESRVAVRVACDRGQPTLRRDTALAAARSVAMPFAWLPLLCACDALCDCGCRLCCTDGAVLRRRITPHCAAPHCAWLCLHLPVIGRCLAVPRCGALRCAHAECAGRAHDACVCTPVSWSASPVTFDGVIRYMVMFSAVPGHETPSTVSSSVSSDSV